jgi:hypothetical protein
MFSAMLGGTIALSVFTVITVVFLLLCCVGGFALFVDTMDQIEDDLEDSRRELPEDWRRPLATPRAWPRK